MAPGIKFQDPPAVFSKEKIQAWLNEEIAKSKLNVPHRIVDTPEWEHYVNYDHFVPGTIEGLPEGYKFDYNWTPEKPHKGVPSAEVTEEGKLMLWWQRCNWHELNEQECRDYIYMVVAHEGRHYVQWQRIAVNVLTALGFKVDPKNLPKNIDDLAAYPGAKEAFMRIWANGAHYQCREVEVYTEQITSGEKTKENNPMFDRHLQALYIYVYGSDYSPGCANSEWAPEFSSFIKAAEELFKKYNIGPADRESI